MNKDLQKILSIYNTILENKNIVLEVSDIYPNIDFKDYVVGNSTPSKDNLNLNLLSDIQKAAELSNIKVGVTTGTSGHESLPSRHPSGNAVDIAIINGESVSKSNRNDADKFVNALVGMGYVKNRETSNDDKAVLTFGVPGHDNHVHVSNSKGNVETLSDKISSTVDASITPTISQTQSDVPIDTTVAKWAGKIGKALGYTESIQEQINFGTNYSNISGTILLPSGSNPKIKSPISGIVNNTRYNSGCKNQITIENTDNSKIYLEFCGISRPTVKDGESISEGQVIGKTDTDVEVILYDSSFNRINISDSTNLSNKSKQKPIEYDKDKKREQTYSDPALAAMMLLPSKILSKVFQNKTDKSGKIVQKRWGSPTDKKPVDPWIIDAIKDPFGTKRKKLHNEEDKKLTENIKRIKKLL